MNPSNSDALAQSVKQRLMNRARQRAEDFNALLTRFAIERLLYRLTCTPHARKFTLKGATLFAIWADRPHRPTLDVDLLSAGEPTSEELRGIFDEACVVPVTPDGMRFEPESISVDAIREENIYQGLRIKLTAHLGSARIPLQVDVGFGDVITPGPTTATLGPLLDFPPPVIAAYPPETAIAEKVEAMVTLGMSNSRMKDFFDVYTLARTMGFDGEVLMKAIRATFTRRRTNIPDRIPPGLSDEFASDAIKRTQWSAFSRRVEADQRPADFSHVIKLIAEFMWPVLDAAGKGKLFTKRWEPQGPWHDRAT